MVRIKDLKGRYMDNILYEKLEKYNKPSVIVRSFVSRNFESIMDGKAALDLGAGVRK